MKQIWISTFCIIALFHSSLGALRRCYKCRSRSELGSCKDPFKYNVTLLDKERGVEAIPCASGWCGKILEGGSTFTDSDYGIATQRLCLPRSPSDNEERCARTDWEHKKVYLCMCQGDLCNNAPTILPKILLTSISIFIGSLLL